MYRIGTIKNAAGSNNFVLSTKTWIGRQRTQTPEIKLTTGVKDIVYKSKVAKWYLWFCIGMTIALAGSIYLCYQSTWILLIDIGLMGAGLIMMFDMLFHTDYTINGKRLHIRCGFLYRMNLPISKISEITHKSTILSSPALSTKRIGLKYGKTNWVYISPKNQDEFISALLSINPKIEII